MTGRPEPLKALSVRQPWLELILRGVKVIEYRSQSTRTRATIYLYASRQRYTPAEERAAAAQFGVTMTDEELDGLPRGVVAGRVDLVGCEWCEAEGRYHWHLRRPVRLRTPVPPAEKPQPIFFHPFGKPASGGGRPGLRPLSPSGEAKGPDQADRPGAGP